MKFEHLRIALDSIVSIVLISVLFMWTMPYGSFNLTEPGFYLCIALAAGMELLIRFILKKIQQRPGEMNPGLAAKFRTLEWIALMAICFMWLMPYGSFDPLNFGFYLCIALAAFIELATNRVIARNRVKS